MKIYDFNGKKNISGQRIREARIKLHWSQKALAVRLVADYEIKMLAKVLNTSVTWLLGIE